MIKVFIPTDEEFNYKQCKKLFKKYRDKINDNSEFRNIVKDTFFYSFFDYKNESNTFLGCIYYYEKDNKLYVNAYASRKHHLKNIECFKMSLNWFNCDIYAKTTHKTAIFCLLKCGFKRISENEFIYRR